ncbi:Excitatory amino acid transporter 3 [Halotydeus destructor]|nr:Excitatory amino acid transporter 3 [Halotydeus destructor]
MGFFKWYGSHVTSLSFVSMVMAIVLGMAIKSSKGAWVPRELMYLEFPGTLFMRMLMCIILPLIVSSIISSIGTLDPNLTGKIGSRAVAYYSLSTVTAITVAIALTTVVRPGRDFALREGVEMKTARVVTMVDSILDLLRNLTPTNIIEACFAGSSTSLRLPKHAPGTMAIEKWAISIEKTSGTNIIGLTAFSIFLGLALSKLGEKGKPLLLVFSSLSEASMLLTAWVVTLTPIGIMFLIMPRIIEVDDIAQMLKDIGFFAITVIVAHSIHCLIILPAYYFLITQKNPYSFLRKISKIMVTGFCTASSSATLPVTIQVLIEEVGLDSRIVRFLVPVGATINMDGSGIEFGSAIIFLAQIRQRSFSVPKLIATGFMVAAASVGCAGIPNSGLIVFTLILNAVGLPVEDVAIYLMAEFLVDRFSTVVNVIGDSFGAAILDHLCHDDLYKVAAILEPVNRSNSSDDTDAEVKLNVDDSASDAIKC